MRAKPLKQRRPRKSERRRGGEEMLRRHGAKRPRLPTQSSVKKRMGASSPWSSDADGLVNGSATTRLAPRGNGELR
jgi:hypothetical protein